MPARPRVVRGRMPNASSEPPSNAALTSHTTHRSAMNPPIVATLRRRYCPTPARAELPCRGSLVEALAGWIMRSEKREARSEIRDTRCEIRDTRYEMRDTRCEQFEGRIPTSPLALRTSYFALHFSLLASRISHGPRRIPSFNSLWRLGYAYPDADSHYAAER